MNKPSRSKDQSSPRRRREKRTGATFNADLAFSIVQLLIGRSTLDKVDKLAARLLALAEAVEADDEKAVKQLAAESRSKDWRALIEQIGQALDEGDEGKQMASRFLHDTALPYVFRWTPDGLTAFERWRERLRMLRPYGTHLLQPFLHKTGDAGTRSVRVQIGQDYQLREDDTLRPSLSQQRRQWEEMPETSRRSLRIIAFGMSLHRSSNPPGQEKKANLINSLIEADEAIVDRYWEMLPADLQAPQLAEISLLRADPGSLPAASPEEVTR